MMDWEKDVKELRSIVWKGHPKAIKDKKSISLVATANGDKSILDSCSIKQSDETIVKKYGKDACQKALEEFEELIQSDFNIRYKGKIMPDPAITGLEE